MGQIHVGVRRKRRLRSAAGFVFRAMAPGAIGAKHRIKSLFEGGQRPCFVEVHVVVGDGFDVDAATSVRKLAIPEFRPGCGCANNSKQSQPTKYCNDSFLRHRLLLLRHLSRGYSSTSWRTTRRPRYDYRLKKMYYGGSAVSKGAKARPNKSRLCDI